MQIQKQQLYLLAFGAVFVTLGAYLVQPLWDMDFWWHIAGGKWIVEMGTIPATDPFAVFSDADPVRLTTLLRAEWLGQVLLFLCYNTFGVYGIVAVRVLLILICVGLIVRRAGKLQAPQLVTLLYIGLAGAILTGFTGSRPQLLSFLFAAVTFALLDAYDRSRNRWLLVILPPLAILWSNCHGGGILGAVLVVMYCGLKALEKIIRTRSFDKNSAVLLLTALLFTAGTLITPNSIITYQYLLHLEGSQLQQITSEYISSFKLYTLGLTGRQILVGLLFAVTLGGLAGLARARKTELLITIFLAVISALYYRYLPFLIVVSGPYICQGLGTILSRSWCSRFRVNSTVETVLVLAAASAAVLILAFGTLQNQTFRTGVNQRNFPVNAVDYIEKNNISGKAFNHFKWGGYLLWNLYPQVKVFIDGRMLDGNRLPPYTHILWATPQGIRFFNDQKFDLVILPWKTYYSGVEYKLHGYLRSRPMWKMIYFDRVNMHLVYQRTEQGRL